MEDLLDSDVFAQMNNIMENRRPLIDALRRYPFTMLHGDYRADNLAYPNYPAVLDWQEASCALMTIDLAWFVLQDFGRESIGQTEIVKYYRRQLETYLHQRFEDTDWQAMLDLGFLVNALRSTCYVAYWYKQHAIENNIQDRDHHESKVKMRNQQIRDAMHWI
jgi:aminoglycoside phosphotransferase (APT) family kinase protein